MFKETSVKFSSMALAMTRKFGIGIAMKAKPPRLSSRTGTSARGRKSVRTAGAKARSNCLPVSDPPDG